MAENVRIGLKTKFRCDLDDYERWKADWTSVTKEIRLKAEKTGKDLSEIRIMEGADEV